MKKSAIMAAVLFLTMTFVAVCIAAVESGQLTVKANDKLFVCNCGEKCPCETMGRKAGKCSCGKQMAEVTVSKAEEGKAYFTMNGKERSMSTTGKYACACGPKCDCDYISQKPGKCGCGKDLKKIE